MKLIILALPLLFPAHAFAGTTESTLQYILDDYQAQCVASQNESMETVPEGEDLSAVNIKLDDDSIYEIDILLTARRQLS